MEKKNVLALTSLLILTTLLTTPSMHAPVTSAIPPEGPYHWKIELAQKKCNAWIGGYLIDPTGLPIPGTTFVLNCTCEEEDPQPSQRVYCKVKTDVIPIAIAFNKTIDWDKDGYWDEMVSVYGDLVEEDVCHRWYHHQQHRELVLFPMGPVNLTDPVCSEWEGVPTKPPFAGLWHLSSWHDSGWPYGNLSYCDQVDLTPLDVPGIVDWWHVKEVWPGPVLVLDQLVVVEVHSLEISHQWQLTVKQHNCNVVWDGFLTDIAGDPIPGTIFEIICNCTALQCTVVQTPNCTLVGDIDSVVEIYSKDGPLIGADICYEKITQFPWRMVRTGWDPFTGDSFSVELELTEVQMHNYVVMGGETTSSGQMGAFVPWFEDEPDAVPFATRPPDLTPLLGGQNITFEQVDPITGIVEIAVPADSYDGLDHTYFSPRVGMYFRVQVFLNQCGCGVIFTGQGKEPVEGCVDLITYNNNTGVYTFGPDQIAETADDELLAGQLDSVPPAYPAAGAGPPLGPCLQNLRGPDGIPGTGDDPIGRGDLDGPDPPGSSILFLPTTVRVTFWDGAQWNLLFESPWPQLLTTGTAYDEVIEPASVINGVVAKRVGEPWEFFAGLDHPEYVDPVHWKHDKCNAYVTYVCVWSVLNVGTALGGLDVHFKVVEKKVREDCVIADINCDEIVDIVDIVIAALAFGAQDEGFGNQVADPNYDARGDVANPRGMIDIVDIVRIAINFGWQLTPNCIQ